MNPKTERYQKGLSAVAERLAELARLLHSEGLEEEAQSIETTIADLGWQREELESESNDAITVSRAG